MNDIFSFLNQAATTATGVATAVKTATGTNGGTATPVPSTAPAGMSAKTLYILGGVAVAALVGLLLFMRGNK